MVVVKTTMAARAKFETTFLLIKIKKCFCGLADPKFIKIRILALTFVDLHRKAVVCQTASLVVEAIMAKKMAARGKCKTAFLLIKGAFVD